MQVLEFNKAVEQVVKGKKVEDITKEMIAPPEGNRSDDEDGAIAAGFQKIISDFESRYPYVDSAWVNRISDELKSGSDVEVLMKAAEQNRNQYLDQAKIDAGGSFDTWDAILRALQANYQPPQL